MVSDFTAYRGRVYFGANDGRTGNQPWSTDGTLAGTKRIAKLGFAFSLPRHFTIHQDRLLFIAEFLPFANTLYSTDGTVVSQWLPGRTALVSPASPLTSGGSRSLYFVGRGPGSLLGNEVWKTDGTAASGRVLTRHRGLVFAHDSAAGSTD